MRRLPAFALLGLAGCDALIDDCVDATFYPDYGIEVKNAGNRDARLTVVYDEWVDDDHDDDTPDELKTRVEMNYIVAGEKQTVWYAHEALTVTIERILDGQILYQDHLSRADFRRENGRFEITVYP
ncbi:MAG TPA: hypothetical protein VF950_09590 [Planctomycetota bacterium]